MNADHASAHCKHAPEPLCSGALAAGCSRSGDPLRWLLVPAGLLCVGLAAAGMFLPLLPTTPFLLLAAACFARSSTRLHHCLYANCWFGPYLKAYRNGEGLPLKAKASILLLLWLSLGTSMFLAVPPRLWWVRLLLALIGAGVTVHLLRQNRPA